MANSQQAPADSRAPDLANAGPSSVADLELPALSDLDEELKQLAAINAELLSQSHAPAGATAQPPAAGDDDASDMDEELKQLAAINAELLSQPRGVGTLDVDASAMDDELKQLAAINAELMGQLRGPAPAGPDSAETTALRAENAALRARLEELEEMLTAGGVDETWSERQREYESLLEEKSEVIRDLYLKLQSAQEGGRRSPDEPVPREEELIQLKKELEEQRRQLQEDEEAVMAQMRQMELALSKDRAELARQRQEVQRLQTELNREIELSGRDTGLRDRLNNLRRPQEGPRRGSDPTLPPPTADESDPAAKQNSGLFRRLFG